MEDLHDLTISLRKAEVTMDKEREREIRHRFGVHYHLIGKYDKAIENFEMCLTIAKQIGDKDGEGIAYGNLGTCHTDLGQYDKAIQYHKIRLTIAREIGDKKGEGLAYCKLGICYCDLGQYDKAIQYQKIRLTIAKNIGDKTGEGVVYNSLGVCYSYLGQYDEAIKYHEMALTIAKETEYKKGEGAVYNNLGVCYIHLSQYDKAIRHMEMGLTIAKEIGDKKYEGVACGNLGSCYIALGQYDKAIKLMEMGLTIAKDIRDKKSEGNIYGSLGCCYSHIGQYDQAIKYHEMGLTIAKEIGNKKCQGEAYGCLGCYYSYLGQYDKAIRHLEMGLTIANVIGDTKCKGTAYGNLGYCYSNFGQYDQAIKYHEMSLTIAKEIGCRNIEGEANGNLGCCYSHLGQYDKAIKYHEMGLTIAKEIGNTKSEGIACCNLGCCYNKLGQYDQAINYLKMFLRITKEIGHREAEGRAYSSLGGHYMSLCQFAIAIECLKMALAIKIETGGKEHRADDYDLLGVCYVHFGQYDKAKHMLRKGVECCQELFASVPKWDKDKVSFIDTSKGIYKQLMLILLAQEEIDEALLIAEKGRSRALADLLLNTYPVQYAFITEAKILDLHDIRKLVKTLGSTVIYFALSASYIFTWIIQPNGDIMFQKRCSEMGQQSKEYYMKHSVQDIDSLVHKAIELMTPRKAVRCEDRSLSFLYPEKVSKPAEKRPNSTRARAAMVVDLTFRQPPEPNLPHTAPTLEKKVATTTAPVCQGETWVSNITENSDESLLICLLKDLYQILLSPVRKYLVGSKAIVVPEGPLALVPFSALLDESTRIITESFHVRIIPSLATAKMIRERPEEPAGQGRPLVVGDPDIGEVVKGEEIILAPRLPFANKEAEVVSQFLDVKPLLGERATKKRFLQKVESANLIHIATHGDAERGEILFAPCAKTNRRNIEDIMVTISDLERKRINAKLVVLSCCYSGRGKVRGEGVIGIARAFLGAGARAVLATLWAVNDRATLCFMYRFYEYLTSGDSASEALKKAMKSTRELEKFRHPRYWAPFVLLGEDVTPFVKPCSGKLS